MVMSAVVVSLRSSLDGLHSAINGFRIPCRNLIEAFDIGHLRVVPADEISHGVLQSILGLGVLVKFGPLAVYAALVDLGNFR